MPLKRRFTDWFFSVPEGDRSLRDIVIWWEVRRVPFNLIVCTVGLCSLVLFFVFIIASGKLHPGDDPVEPFALWAAPFLLNICYTAGWVTEGLFGHIWSAEGAVAPRMMKFGLGLSLALVLLPAVAWGRQLLAVILGLDT